MLLLGQPVTTLATRIHGAMSTHGKISSFNPGHEPWTSYAERLGYYFAANDIVNEAKKKAILLTVCGPTTYQLLKSLLQPISPADKTYSELLDVLSNHFNPTPSPIVQRFKFNSRVRQSGESVATYVAELKLLGEHCGFADRLNEMVRDRLVCGINDPHIQRRLLQESDLTYKRAFEIAQAMEVASRDIHDLQKQSIPTPTVQHLQERRHTKRYTCYRCGGNHTANKCSFLSAECRACGKLGHIAKVCRSKSKKMPKATTGKHKQTSINSVVPNKTPPLTPDPPLHCDGQEAYTLFTLPGKAKPIVLTVKINGSDIPMELDTGASVSIINEQIYRSIFHSTGPLQPTDITLATYTGEALTILGSLNAHVEYQAQSQNLPLLVVQGNGPSLFGRNWLEKIKLDWTSIYSLQESLSVTKLLERHATLFSDKLGALQGPTAQLFINPQARPRYFKARPVPYRLKEKVEMELSRLQELHVIAPVQHADWATPVVPILKKDGTLRLCGDYKVTINQALTPDNYPLPRIEDIFAVLEGGKLFSKLDLSHAYQQIRLHENSKQYTTINTHKGLFEYQRLPFGISTAPSLFQRIMENLLQDLPNVCVYLDDILVSGTSEDHHFQNLDRVLTRLSSVGLTLKHSKCVFASTSVEYLGHIIDSCGLHPSNAKVKAVKEAPAPTTVTELRAFLGLINYYHKFLPNLSTVLAPLHALLRKGAVWTWSKAQVKAFQQVKEVLQSSLLLVHFDSQKPVILSCDASPYGLGAVLAHQMPDGSEKPIAFTSRTLSSAERNYSQLEKEALAIVFSVKRFHQYLYGTHFTLYSDHKPLERLLSESREVPPMASARIQRWSLTLSAYQYTIKHRAGTRMANADALSRLPIPETPQVVPLPGDLSHLVNHLTESIVTASQIKEWTDKDPIISRVRRLIQTGWTISSPSADLAPYYHRHTELSVLDGCLLWGSRVVIPRAGHHIVLNQLHDTHPGISKMKMLARSYVWWPGIDSDIQTKVQTCNVCQYHRPVPCQAPLHPWEFPRQPWTRVHVDHAGPFMGKQFFLLIDAYSKWLEVHIVPSTSSEVTIKKLQEIFASHGIPMQLVSDNGTAFTSHTFQSYMKQHGIKHILTSPYHPSSNGLAERAVQTLKTCLKKLEGSVEARVLRFLSRYRVTPHSTTELSPAELLMGRRLRTSLDLLHPDTSCRVADKQNQGVTNKQLRTFSIGDPVFARNFYGSSKWIPATVVKITGPVSYKVKTASNIVLRRHVDQLRFRYSNSSSTSNEPPLDHDDWPIPTSPTPTSTHITDSQTLPQPNAPVVPTLRRSSRVRNPVIRFSPHLN